MSQGGAIRQFVDAPTPDFRWALEIPGRESLARAKTESTARFRHFDAGMANPSIKAEAGDGGTLDNGLFASHSSPFPPLGWIRLRKPPIAVPQLPPAGQAATDAAGKLPRGAKPSARAVVFCDAGTLKIPMLPSGAPQTAPRAAPSMPQEDVTTVTPAAASFDDKLDKGLLTVPHWVESSEA